MWNTVETLDIVQPAQQHIAAEIKQLRQDCAVAEVKLDLTEGFRVQELRPELSTEQLETFITERVSWGIVGRESLPSPSSSCRCRQGWR